jgi:hypothetical protein
MQGWAWVGRSQTTKKFSRPLCRDGQGWRQQRDKEGRGSVPPSHLARGSENPEAHDILTQCNFLGLQPDVGGHACNPSTQEAELGGSQVQGQPRLYSETEKFPVLHGTDPPLFQTHCALLDTQGLMLCGSFWWKSQKALCQADKVESRANRCERPSITHQKHQEVL